MRRQWSALLCFFLLLFAAATAFSQSQSSIGSASLWVTASSGSGHVHFAAVGVVQHMRLEVINYTGETVYVSDLQPGSILDWDIESPDGSRLPDGSYACMITVEGFGGQSSYRHGFFRVDHGTVTFEAPERAMRTSEGGVESPETVIVMREEREIAMTYVAHDGS